MVRELIHDPLLLARKSAPATIQDAAIATDLRDTLWEHRENCAGMAANMIGELKRIIAFWEDSLPAVIYNPHITRALEPFDTAEGCLSLLGDPRKVRRYKKITLEYEIPAKDGKTLLQRTKTYRGFPAQVIQHEIDHCDGVLI